MYVLYKVGLKKKYQIKQPKKKTRELLLTYVLTQRNAGIGVKKIWIPTDFLVL